MMEKAERKLNIDAKCEGLTANERKALLRVVRKMAENRRRDNMPRLAYSLFFR